MAARSWGDLSERVVLTSCWRGRVHEAQQDIPNSEGSLGLRRAPAGVPTQCGACGEDGAVLVSAHNDSGTGWRQYYCQYACPACGRFTVYHFDD